MLPLLWFGTEEINYIACDDQGRIQLDQLPESSARSIVIAQAALRSLGREGVAGLVDHCCEMARLFREEQKSAGFEILNDVVLNQVVATVPGYGHLMSVAAAAVRESGEAWIGPTKLARA